ncbi:UNKNOWN [Stylonychia lemnae]|uniref:Uncharacterized protein n=1 Tax=Stylonychia lemnae TaxID=5949 RepID=A0A077ZUZ0_STYLE|nr:UNKNOWN [Stylonychia lemnae]|eukprot:CDW72261.1 UNKNOWN [Stylonychia lemnae]
MEKRERNLSYTSMSRHKNQKLGQNNSQKNSPQGQLPVIKLNLNDITKRCDSQQTHLSTAASSHVSNWKGKSDRFTGGFMNLMYQDNSLQAVARQKNLNSIRLSKLKQIEEMQRKYELEMAEKREIASYYFQTYGLFYDEKLLKNRSKGDLIVYFQKLLIQRKQRFAARTIQRAFRQYRIYKFLRKARLRLRVVAACRIQKMFRSTKQARYERDLQNKRRQRAAVVVQKVRNRIQPIVRRRILQRNFSYFSQIRLHLMTSAQIKIRYHWFKYKKNKLKKKKVLQQRKFQQAIRARVDTGLSGAVRKNSNQKNNYRNQLAVNASLDSQDIPITPGIGQSPNLRKLNQQISQYSRENESPMSQSKDEYQGQNSQAFNNSFKYGISGNPLSPNESSDHKSDPKFLSQSKKKGKDKIPSQFSKTVTKTPIVQISKKKENLVMKQPPKGGYLSTKKISDFHLDLSDVKKENAKNEKSNSNRVIAKRNVTSQLQPQFDEKDIKKSFTLPEEDESSISKNTTEEKEKFQMPSIEIDKFDDMPLKATVIMTSGTNTLHKLSLNPLDNIIEQDADDCSPLVKNAPCINYVIVNENSGLEDSQQDPQDLGSKQSTMDYVNMERVGTFEQLQYELLEQEKLQDQEQEQEVLQSMRQLPLKVYEQDQLVEEDYEDDEQEVQAEDLQSDY